MSRGFSWLAIVFLAQYIPPFIGRVGFFLARFLFHAKMMSINIEILTKKDCCLCDDAKAIVERVLPDYPATLILTDIESDPALFESYKERIPVVRINGEESFVYKAHEITLRKKLDKILEL